MLLAAPLLGPMLLAASPPAAAQSLPPLDDHLRRVFTVADGLPVREVRQVEQTSDGYLYAGTARGLYRFDGRRFEVVPLRGFGSQIADVLYSDRRGRLWIVTGAAEIGYVEGRSIHRLGLDSVAVATSADRGVGIGVTERRFTETGDGSVWLSGPAGLLRLDPSAPEPIIRYTSADGLRADSVAGLFEVSHGQWVVPTSDGLSRAVRSGGRLHFEPLGPPEPLYTRSDFSARIDDTGLWVAMSAPCLLHYDGETFSRHCEGDADPPGWEDFAWRPGWRGYLPYRFERVGRFGAGPTPSSPNRALVTSRGEVWIAFVKEQKGYLYRGSPDAGLERVELGDESPNTIQDVLEDHQGSVWVASSLGLVQLVPRRVSVLPADHPLADLFTAPVIQTADGVWVGTWGAGLFRFGPGGEEVWLRSGDGLPSDRVRALYPDADTLWVGTKEGAAKVVAGAVVDRLGETSVAAIVRDTSGALLFGTEKGPRRRDGSVLVPLFRDWAGGGVWDLHVARSGRVWIAGHRGLWHWDGRRLRPVPRFEWDGSGAGPVVVTIEEESDGTLWFNTYEHGIYRYREGRLARITEAEGLHENAVWRMIPDEYGGLWLSGDAGISRVRRDRLHRVADATERGEPPVERLTPIVFGRPEGMRHPETNRAAPAGWPLDDGKLVFNGVEGIAVIDPARALAPLKPSPTVIESVRADGTEVPVEGGGETVLSPGVRHVLFEFGALSFLDPAATRYRYRLDGYDEAWLDPTPVGRASYTNLPPGSYEFRVQSSVRGGRWDGTPTRYAFTVPAHVWQTRWFRGLLAIAGLGALWSLHRYRLKRALELERLRLRIAADLHDDIGSNLSSIAILSEMAAERVPRSAPARVQLTRIRAAAEETVDSLRDVIWLVDPQHQRIRDLVARMQRVARDLLPGQHHAFHTALRNADRIVPMAFMRAVLLVYKEALHNAVRHSGADRVEVSVRSDATHLSVRVADDGEGFDEADLERTYGLDTMRRRARAAGGTVEVETGRGEGTAVTLRVPMA